MKRLILTIILGILITSLTGCEGYRHYHPRSRGVVVVTGPAHYPPAPPPPPRRPHRNYTPPPMPRQGHHRF